MIVHVDTSALVDALTGSRRSLDTLIALTAQGHRLMLSAIVLYEWQRGPRIAAVAREEIERLGAEELRVRVGVAIGRADRRAFRGRPLHARVDTAGVEFA